MQPATDAIRSYISFGSNLGDRLAHIRSALSKLDASVGIHRTEVSPLYRSGAVGPGVQGDYINGVVRLDTSLTANALLALLQRCENDAGRVRETRWGPRTLDLDLLLYGDAIICSPDLVVPHPRMTARNFVIYPMLDLDPYIILPDGTIAADLREVLGDKDLYRLEEWIA